MLKFLMKYKVRDRVQEYSSGPFGLGRAIEARDHMRSLGFAVAATNGKRWQCLYRPSCDARKWRSSGQKRVGRLVLFSYSRR